MFICKAPLHSGIGHGRFLLFLVLRVRGVLCSAAGVVGSSGSVFVGVDATMGDPAGEGDFMSGLGEGGSGNVATGSSGGSDGDSARMMSGDPGLGAEDSGDATSVGLE